MPDPALDADLRPGPAAVTERADVVTAGGEDGAGSEDAGGAGGAAGAAGAAGGRAAGAAARAGADGVAGRVAVVTDSTADLPSALAGGVRVVPLEVRLGDRVVRDGVDIGPGELSAAIADRRLDVQTSRPTPEAFAETYRELLAAGASAVVSVHLSRELSGTWEAARLAAAQVDPDRVRVVDSRAMGMGLGFAVLAADRAAAEGADPAEVEAAAAAVARRCRVIFCVDSLDRLRRGGRIGAAAAVLGTVLAVKPLLHLVDGRITALEKVRTSARATQRLVEHAITAAGDEADLAVHHLGVPERADELADRLAERLPGSPRPVVSEISAVIGAHVGNGALGVVVVPRG